MLRAVFSLALLLVLASPGAAQTAGASDPLVARAAAILREVPIFDGHNDLPYMLGELSGGHIEPFDIALPQPRLHTDLARLRQGGVGAQFWSAYVDVDSARHGGALRHALRQIDLVHRLVERYPELEFATTADDVVRLQRQGKIASLIGVEGGHTIENSLSALRIFHRLGVRYLTLTHSRNTDWADATTDFPRHNGLTEFGEEVVREMNRLGIFVDLSHVSAETMLDALRVSQAPVLFSHSSARAVNAHPRNVPDEVLRLLPANGGVVMVNFASGFVAPEAIAWNARRDSVAEALRAQHQGQREVGAALAAWLEANPAPRGTVQDMADHVDHIRRVAGVDHIGIGSDFDGVTSLPVGLDDVSTYPVLFAELLRRGYSEQELKKIAGLNVLRAMREMERAAARIHRERGPSLADVPAAGAL